ncbi:hypothetical protein SAMN06298212_1052 [Ruaniaceae bacterium KH17]|nr:hypothetical protein SAMN06298212_1052 [Ruaniaceae bacterium KH17]
MLHERVDERIRRRSAPRTNDLSPLPREPAQIVCGDHRLPRCFRKGVSKLGQSRAKITFAIDIQRREISLAPRCKNGSDRYYEPASDIAVSKGGVDEYSPDSPVTVGERVDGLKLGMDEGGLYERIEIRAFGSAEGLVESLTA